MQFLKPDVTKKNREFFFSLFVLLDLLFTASNLTFERLDPSQILEGFWASISETSCPEMLVFGK